MDLIPHLPPPAPLRIICRLVISHPRHFMCAYYTRARKKISFFPTNRKTEYIVIFFSSFLPPTVQFCRSSLGVEVSSTRASTTQPPKPPTPPPSFHFYRLTMARKKRQSAKTGDVKLYQSRGKAGIDEKRRRSGSDDDAMYDEVDRHHNRVDMEEEEEFLKLDGSKSNGDDESEEDDGITQGREGVFDLGAGGSSGDESDSDSDSD